MTRTGAVAFIGLLLCSGAAAAEDWVPGFEISGQSVRVQTNGVTNTVRFNPDGTATILTPSGNPVQGTWRAADNKLCLATGGAEECVPYTRAFQAGQPVTLTSSCNSTSQWLAQSINQPPPPEVSPERG